MFQLDKSFVAKFADKKPKFGFNGLGEVVYMRTYSRLKLNGSNERWFETVERVVNGTYRMQQNWVESNQLEWQEKKSQRSAQDMYRRMFYMKFLPPGRGLWAMGSTITEERGLYPALNNCFVGSEKFVTREGFKSFSDTQGTIQTILTENGEWKKAPVKSFGFQKVWKLTLQRQGIQKEILTTANHRWFSKSQSEINHSKGWKVRETKDLVEGMRLPYKFGQKVTNFSPQGVVHGYAFGNGTRDRIDVCNSEDEFIFKYTHMNRITGETSNTIRDIPKHYKEKPLLYWDKKYLQGWLMGYFAADGSCDKTGQVTISSSKKANLEFVQEVCSIVGIGYYSVNLSSTSSNLKQERSLYKLSLMPSTLTNQFFLKKSHKDNFNKNIVKRYWNVFSVEDTDKTDKVFCVQVPEKESFTLSDQIFTKNCAFVSTENLKEDKSKPFCFLMDMSMLGVGVGFDTKGNQKLRIYPNYIGDSNIGDSSNIYVIPDSREGWVKSVELLLESYFNDNMLYVDFDYSRLRAQGELIKGFGGKASGPAPLKELHQSIRDLLDPIAAHNGRITITVIVDIMNLIGKAVVAGNVRRSAEIAFGDPKDEEFLDLKNPELYPVELKSHRWASNNTVFAELGMDYSNVADRTRRNGEPGYAWMHNMQAYGRMADQPNWKDKRAQGGNPCLEQTLESYELCCLVEVFPENCKDYADFQKTLKSAYLYAKTVTLGQSHWPETNRVMLRNRRIGCSMSGLVQFISSRGLGTLQEWCEKGYKYIREVDRIYSEWLVIKESIKCTSVKPSGSVSKLPGATSGVHWPTSRYCKVRVRIAKNHGILQDILNAGYTAEECFYNPTSMAVEFPVDYGPGLRAEEDVSCWEKISLAAFMQSQWADNQVSATITFDPTTEGNQIEPMLDYFQYQLKGVSLLPMIKGGAYPQMSYEPITKEEYLKMCRQINPITWTAGADSEAEKFCDTDACALM